MARHFFGGRNQTTRSKRLSYASLKIATNNFSGDRLIGEGGHAKVYKAHLPDGSVVAVKEYKEFDKGLFQKNQGDMLSIFEVISRLHHRNINQVIGFCVEKDHTLLVTEYEKKGSIRQVLKNQNSKESPALNWDTRAAIIVGIARGISYLHEGVAPHIIHRDIKTGNILLDQNFTPKIIDFDLVEFFDDHSELPRDTTVLGTYGFADPEYVATGKLTEKADVYGFGVVMLEIISGREAVQRGLGGFGLITEWAAKMAKAGRVADMADPAMSSEFSARDVKSFVEVALLCTRSDPKLRPAMEEVVFMLHGSSCWRALGVFDDGRSHVDGEEIKDEAESQGITELESSVAANSSSNLDESTGCSDKITPIVDNIMHGERAESSRAREDREKACVVSDKSLLFRLQFQNSFPLPVSIIDHIYMARDCFGGRSQTTRNSDADQSKRLSYASLQIATKNFSGDRLIGEGGNAKVYKAHLPDGSVVAVRKYKKSCRRDVLSIFEVISRLHHRNINQVTGFCVEKDQMLLVTEYERKGSIRQVLKNQNSKEAPVLNWDTRAAIIVGISRGISYLHEGVAPHIIHRDIKTENILLDQNFTPKIIDFDLVEFFDDHSELPRDTPVIGTLGYLDPEYAVTGKLTEKADVFGFGAVMLEIISGRAAFRGDGLGGFELITEWAAEMAKAGRVADMADPAMSSEFSARDVKSFVEVALSCTRRDPKLRPAMEEVVFMLHGSSCRRALGVFDDGRSHVDGEEIENEAESQGITELESSVAANSSSNLDESTGCSDMITPIVDNIMHGERAESSGAREDREKECVVGDSTEERIARQRRKKKMEFGVVLSGSDDIVERLSQTMVFKRYSDHVCPEAVYPPFLTSVYPIRDRQRR